MGGGSFDSSTYAKASATRAATGVDDFAFTRSMASTPRSAQKAHETLDPLTVNNNGDRAGKNIRESLDSDGHPNSRAIVTLFDTTGSMGSIPKVFQSKLADLFALLLAKGYVDDPQIAVGAIADAHFDPVPLQVGQFESDNAIDESLRNVFLTGGGGSNDTESYLLAMYFIAFHTYIDCWEKRGEKGFLFLIGDERTEGKLNRHHIEQWTGDVVEADMAIEDIYAALSEKWNVYFIFPTTASYPEEYTLDGEDGFRGSRTPDSRAWRPLLGQAAMTIDDPDGICELIALVIGLECGTIDIDTGVSDLAALGRDSKLVGAISKSLALSGYGTGGGGGGGVVPLGTSDGDIAVSDGDDGVDRL